MRFVVGGKQQREDAREGEMERPLLGCCCGGCCRISIDIVRNDP